MHVKAVQEIHIDYSVKTKQESKTKLKKTGEKQMQNKINIKINKNDIEKHNKIRKTTKHVVYSNCCMYEGGECHQRSGRGVRS